MTPVAAPLPSLDQMLAEAERPTGGITPSRAAALGRHRVAVGRGGRLPEQVITETSPTKTSVITAGIKAGDDRKPDVDESLQRTIDNLTAAAIKESQAAAAEGRPEDKSFVEDLGRIAGGNGSLAQMIAAKLAMARSHGAPGARVELAARPKTVTEEAVSDVLTSGMSGLISAASAPVGLASILTQGRAGQLAERAGFSAKDIQQGLNKSYSPSLTAANKAFADAKTFGEKLKVLAANPEIAAHAIVQSAPSMFAGGLVSRPLVALGAPGAAAAAIGEGAVAAGSAAEDIRQASPSGTLTDDQSALAAGTGIVTGIINRLSGGLAKQFGFADAHALIAGATRTPAVRKTVVRELGEMLGATVGEASEEAAQSFFETLLGNQAKGKPLTEGLTDAVILGAAAGGGMGVGAHIGRASTDQRPPSEKEIRKAEIERMSHRLNIPQLPPSQPVDARRGVEVPVIAANRELADRQPAPPPADLAARLEQAAAEREQAVAPRAPQVAPQPVAEPPAFDADAFAQRYVNARDAMDDAAEAQTSALFRQLQPAEKRIARDRIKAIYEARRNPSEPQETVTPPSASQSPSPAIRISTPPGNEGVSGSWVDFLVEAVDGDGKRIGYVDYVVNDFGVHIIDTAVDGPRRRQGVATAMYDAIRAKHPNAKFLVGDQTPDGAKFRSAWESRKKASPSDSPSEPEGIRAAAVVPKNGGAAIEAPSHWQAVEEAQKQGLKPEDLTDVFVTTTGRVVDRIEAEAIDSRLAGAEPTGEPLHTNAMPPSQPAPASAEVAASTAPAQAVEGSAPVAAQTGAVPVPKGGAEYTRLWTKDIVAAPHIFQYKQGGDAKTGAGNKLKNQKVYKEDRSDPLSVWRDPSSGIIYVVNGHHRLELAQRTGHPSLPVRFINAANADQARVEGALSNIAQGMGTPLDAAKFLRMVGPENIAALKDEVDVDNAVAKHGMGLAKLADDLFARVERGDIEEATAATIGAELSSPAQQRTAFNAVVKAGKRLSDGEVQELARQVRDAGTATVSQDSLFGTEELEQSLFVERAQVANAVRKRLGADKRLFGLVANKRRAETLARGKNVIDVEESQAIASESGRLEEIFKGLYTRSGPIATAITEAARRVANGEKPADVVDSIYGQVREAIQADLAGGFSRGPEEREAGHQGREAQDPQVPEADGRVDDSDDPSQDALFERGPRYGGPDLFGNEAPRETFGLFGEDDTAGKKAPAAPTSTEGGFAAKQQAAKERAEFLRKQLTRMTDAKTQRTAAVARQLQETAAELAQLDRIAGLGQRITPDEMRARALGENDAPAKSDDAQPRLLERGTSYTQPSEDQADLFAEMRANPNGPQSETVIAFGSPDEKAAALKPWTTFMMRLNGLKIPSLRQRLTEITAHGTRQQTLEQIQLHGVRLRDTEDAAKVMDMLRDPSMERQSVFYLIPTEDENDFGTIVSHNMTTVGALSFAFMPDPVEIAATARRIGATRVLFGHNHPSGLAMPSLDDVAVTMQAAAALKKDGIEVVGHVVINHGTYGWVNVLGERRTQSFTPLPAEYTTGQDSQWGVITQKSAPQLLSAMAAPKVATILALDTQHGIVGATILPLDALDTIEEWLPDFLEKYGAHAILVGAPHREATKLHAAAAAAPTVSWAADVLDIFSVDHADPSSNFASVQRTGFNYTDLGTRSGDYRKRASDTRTVRSEDGPVAGRVRSTTAVQKDAANRVAVADFRRGGRVSETAWHGSPHTFDKFSLTKMGTGEGAQSFGWGLYFAGKEELGEYYRTQLSDRHFGSTLVFAELSAAENKALPGWIKNALRGTPFSEKDAEVDRLIRDFEDRLAKAEAEVAAQGHQWWLAQDRVRSATDVLGVLRKLRAGGDYSLRPAGHLYKVEIPDDDTMLHWDKPLSEQPAKVKAALEGGWLVHSEADARMTGATVYDRLVGGIGAEGVSGPEASSRKLASLGITGIKYLNGQSRAKGEGDYNYVVFDDAAIKILEVRERGPKYGKESRDVPQTETAAFKRWFGDSKVVDKDGKPLVVYHGTQTPWDVADLRRSIRGYGEQLLFLTPNPSLASEFAEHTSAADRAVAEAQDTFEETTNALLEKGGAAAWMDFGNTRMLSSAMARLLDDGAISQAEYNAWGDAETALVQAEARADEASESDVPTGASVLPLYASIQNPLTVDVGAFKDGATWDVMFPIIVAKMKAGGHDGAIVKNVRDAPTTDGMLTPNTVVIATQANQIKSATGNSGAFDPNDPSIVRESGPQYGKSEDNEPLSSVKNAASAETREKLGLPEREIPATRSHDEVFEAAKRLVKDDPGAIGKLLNDLRNNPEKIVGTDRDAALLLIHTVTLDKKLHALIDAAETAEQDGDTDAEADARTELATLRDEIAEFIKIKERTGTAVGRALEFRKAMAKHDYSLATMEAMEVAAKGSALDAEELARVKKEYTELHATLAAIQRDAEAANKRAAEVAAQLHHLQLRFEVAGPIGERILAQSHTAADAARARLRARGFRAMSGLDPADAADLAIIGADALLEGVADFSAWSERMIADIGEKITPHLADIFTASQKSVEKKLAGPTPKKSVPLGKTTPKAAKTPDDLLEALRDRVDEDAITLPESRNYLRQLALAYIRSGITEREAVLDALMADANEVFPDATREEVRDALSGYGISYELDTAADKVRLREISAEAQKLAQLESLERGESPKATGVLRQAPNDETRRLTKLVNEAKKRAGIVTGQDRAGRLKSALDAAKTRTRNTIVDLQSEIDTGVRIVKNRAQPISDAELVALKAQLKGLRDLEKQVFGTKEMTDDQRLAMAERLMRGTVAAWHDRVQKAKGGVFGAAKRSLAQSSATLDALKAQAKAARDEYNELKALTDEPKEIHPLRSPKAKSGSLGIERDDAVELGEGQQEDVDPLDGAKSAKNRDVRKGSADQNPEQERINAENAANRRYQAMLSARIAAIKQQIVRDDYTPTPKRQNPLDAESLALRTELQRIKRVRTARMERWKKARRNTGDKVRDAIADAPGVLKSLKASLDNSALFNQGLPVLLTDPTTWYRNQATSWMDIARTYKGDEIVDAVLADIWSRPNADLYRRAQLAIQSAEEDTPTALLQRAPGWVGKSFKASDVAFTAFQYRNRADLFDKYVAMWKEAGVDVTDPREIKSIGRLVNSLTGRAHLGSLERIANVVNVGFFSPRNMASAVNILTAHSTDLLRRDPVDRMSAFARKQAGINLLKIVVQLAGVLALAGWAASAFLDDDDVVEWNPLSTDFGKIRIGDTSFDITRGLGSYVILAARLLSGYRKSARADKITKYESGFGTSSRKDAIYNFLENKASPAGALIKTILEGEDFHRNTVNWETFTTDWRVGARLVKDATLPFGIDHMMEMLDNPKSAPLLLGIIASGVGFNANTYSAETPYDKNKKARERLYGTNAAKRTISGGLVMP